LISTNNHICFVIIKITKLGDCNLGPTPLLSAVLLRRLMNGQKVFKTLDFWFIDT